MVISLPSFKDILTNNQQIKGRLSITATEIQKLYRSQLQQNQKIQKKLAHMEEVVSVSLDRIKNMKSELKYCEETLQKAFHPSTDNISLIYKNVGKHCYIKARFYWQGQQREVQVGSIPIVLDIIQKMQGQGYLHDISLPKSFQMTWKQFKNKTRLIDSTKEIAALKFQEYIIRKLSAEKMDQFEKADLNKRNNKKPAITSQDENYQGEFPEKEKFEWYVKWRNNNLK